MATVLNDKSGKEKCTTQERAILTVLESDFSVKIIVTENKQLQLWIELHAPLPYAVTAVVYFTLTQDINYKQDVSTQSVLTENTVMLFQLESHDVPEDF